MRHFNLIFIFCIGCMCCTNSYPKISDISLSNDEERGIEEQQDSLNYIWNQITDSMVVLGKHFFYDNKSCQRLIEDGGKLNKDKKVYELILPSLSTHNTLYFINWFSTETSRYTFSYWKKTDKNNIRSSDIYTYTNYRYKKNQSLFKDEYGDSVKVYHTNELNIYSEEFLSSCNKWDTTVLKTRKELLNPMRENEHILAFRVIIKNNMYTIQCVPVVRNILLGNKIGSPTYEIISEK